MVTHRLNFFPHCNVTKISNIINEYTKELEQEGREEGAKFNLGMTVLHSSLRGIVKM